MLKNIVFDMDGVLLDTERVYIKSWEKAATEFVAPSDMDKLRVAMKECIGRNDTDTRAYFYETFGNDFPYAAYMGRTREFFNEIEFNEGLPLLPGVRECLTFLNEEGYNVLQLPQKNPQLPASLKLLTCTNISNILYLATRSSTASRSLISIFLRQKR